MLKILMGYFIGIFIYNMSRGSMSWIDDKYFFLSIIGTSILIFLLIGFFISNSTIIFGICSFMGAASFTNVC
jgi:hypothetical protein